MFFVLGGAAVSSPLWTPQHPGVSCCRAPSPPRARCWQTRQTLIERAPVSCPAAPWQQRREWCGTVFSENNSSPPQNFLYVILLCSFCPFAAGRVAGEYCKNRQERRFMFFNANTSPFAEMNDVGLSVRGERRQTQRDKEKLTHLYCAWAGQHSCLRGPEWPAGT